MTTKRTTTKRTKAAPPPEPAAPSSSIRGVDELARLDAFAFRRAMLEQVLADLEVARAAARHTAIWELTRRALTLREEISQHEERERTAHTKMRSSDELLDGLVQAIAKLPDGAFERVAAAVDQRRTGRPRMRVVG